MELRRIAVKDDNKMAGGGISTGSVVAIVLIVLKLTKVIDWPWVYVLIPIWVPAVLIGITLGVLGIAGHVIKKRGEDE